MSVKVKICGLMDRVGVAAAVTNEADMLGFVFAPSKRRVSLAKAQELARLIPKSSKKVGVFVNAPLEEVLTLIKEVPLDMVQCHGNETPDYLVQIPVPVIKVFKVNAKTEKEFDSTQFSAYPTPLFLLDTATGDAAGGTGESFNWESVAIPSDYQAQVIIAGGLTSENVQQAIRQFQPFAVDVSSGVETMGQKDSEKIKAFIKKVKEVAE